jgi:PKD repeat protein
VNGSGSSDPDGSVVSYAWDFGDGATATGATASHTYLAANTYTISLTVTDNSTATNAITHSVTVAAGSTALASDNFSRTVTGGFGTASTAGGAWTSTGTATGLAVTPGVGTIALPAGGRAGAYLGSVSSSSIDVLAKVAFDKNPVAGNGYYAYFYARQKSATSSYQTRVRLTPGGLTKISLSKFDGSSTETSLTAEVSGPTVAPGAKLDVRVQATGTSPTILRVKVWLDSAAEPAAWTQTITDASAALQSAGRIGVEGYLSGATTNAPIKESISSYVANAV